MQLIRAEDGWIVPDGGAPWLRWGFGTRRTILQNEPISVKQVHGHRVLEAARVKPSDKADALVTATPGLLLGIKTADCLPILMADLRQRAVAAVHAGWRGTAEKIALHAVSEMGRIFETKPIDLVVALGPAIGKCCFEVGAEVAREFADFDPALAGMAGKCHLDLQAINTWQLVRASVPRERIICIDRCTLCESDEFWSFRREREQAGRMWSVVGIEEEN